MTKARLRALAFGTTALAAQLTTPALAQTAADSGAPGDIIVTARRVEERVQDVPISITVFSAEQIADSQHRQQRRSR